MKKYCLKSRILLFFALLFLVASVGFVLLARYEKSTVITTFDEQKQISVPILMYHSVCDNKKVVSDYRISPNLLENDLKYLREKGYNTVFVSDLVAYVYEGVELPARPVAITLDDGYLNNLTNVLPLLEKYNMCATVSVVGQFTENFSNTVDRNPLYAYLTWNDINTLSNSGRIEIGNHTYSMHELGERRGCAKIVGESVDTYEEVLKNDLSKLQNELSEKSGVCPIVFTYPYGFVSEESIPVLKELGFLAALTCYEHVNLLDGTSEQLYCLGRFNRSPYLSTEEFMKKIGIE